WGSILGDEGSAYYIGRRALAAACRAYDGRGSATMLMNSLIEHLELNNFTDIVKEIYSKQSSPKAIASLAPLVSQAAKDGDAVATAILRNAAEELALTASAVIEGLSMQDEAFQVAVSGSVFKAGELLLTSFSEYLKPAAPYAQIIPPRFEPAVGAVFLARQVMCGT
ncbi:N-acetylglucosamine kinase, partial [Candidatus Poribacteria bacterium]